MKPQTISTELSTTVLRTASSRPRPQSCSRARNTNQRTERSIDGFSSGKNLRQFRCQQNKIAALPEFLEMFSSRAFTKVFTSILGAHFLSHSHSFSAAFAGSISNSMRHYSTAQNVEELAL